MEDKTIIDSIKELRKSDKKNFKQTVDIVINLKNLDLKKPEHQVDLYVSLPRAKGKKTKVCAFVGPEMLDQAKNVMDTTVSSHDFEKYDDKKLTRKLASNNDYFIAQANIMPKVATHFGRVLGPRSKMPNPKAGCIVPPNANLTQLYEKLQGTVRLSAKKHLVIQAAIGVEDSSDDDLKENVKAIYNALIHRVPQGVNNIKSVYIKYTMGKPVKLM